MLAKRSLLLQRFAPPAEVTIWRPAAAQPQAADSMVAAMMTEAGWTESVQTGLTFVPSLAITAIACPSISTLNLKLKPA